MTGSSPAPRITAISTAVPAGEMDASYCDWAGAQIADSRSARLFERMAARSGIAHRYTVLSDADCRLEPGSFYARSAAPTTAERMALYAREAPELALRAAQGLPSLSGITHLVVASCTGFLAPGLDQILARRLGLSPDVERVSIGFMGCYAGVTALRTARHIARSVPGARVLLVAVELCSLHLQPSDEIEALLAMRQFADGAAAAIVENTGEGLALGEGVSLTLEESDDLITWTIGDTGFAMRLSGEVPARLAAALENPAIADRLTGGQPAAALDAWAVHPGGRSILDAVERGLRLPDNCLDTSRAVLGDYGNMSSATILFVLERLMPRRPANGLALAFGPGLALEGLRFGWIDNAD